MDFSTLLAVQKPILDNSTVGQLAQDSNCTLKTVYAAIFDEITAQSTLEVLTVSEIEHGR